MMLISRIRKQSAIWFGGGIMCCIGLFPPVLVASPSVLSVEERLQRIERIIENPVLLQLSRRLGEQQREIQALQDEIDYLKRDWQKLAKREDRRNKETDDRLSLLEGHVEGLKARVDTSFERLDVLSSSGSLMTSVSALDVDKIRLTEEEDEGSAEGLDKKEVSEQNIQPDIDMTSMAPVITHPATGEEEAAYQVAFSLIKHEQYDESIQAFQSFLKRYPASELASNALYWMGEAFYIKKDNQAAFDAFNQVIHHYPDSVKVPDAMLRAADCLVNLEQNIEAKALYTRLIAEYPEALATEKAMKRLESL